MQQPSTAAKRVIEQADNAQELWAAVREAQADADRALALFTQAFEQLKQLPHGQRRRRAFAEVRRLHRSACKASRHLRAATEAVQSWTTFVQTIQDAGVLFHAHDRN